MDGQLRQRRRLVPSPWTAEIAVATAGVAQALVEPLKITEISEFSPKNAFGNLAKFCRQLSYQTWDER